MILFKKKNTTTVLMLIWIAIITLFTRCSVNNSCIGGQGAITSSTLTLDDFEILKSTGGINITLKQGDTQEVKVIGHSNIINALTTEVNSGLLEIGLEQGCYRDFDLALEITIPSITDIDVTGSGTIILDDFTNQNTLKITLNGSGKIELNNFEELSSIEAYITGSGRIKINEELQVANLNLINNGSGDFSGFNLITTNSVVDISGSGRIELTVVDALDVSIAGSGKVYYKGTPVITQQIAGTGKLIDAN